MDHLERFTEFGHPYNVLYGQPLGTQSDRYKGVVDLWRWSVKEALLHTLTNLPSAAWNVLISNYIILISDGTTLEVMS